MGLPMKRIESWDEFHAAGPGAVFKSQDVTDPENPYPVWHTIPPCGHPAMLVPPQQPNEEGKFHAVTEHEDGTITVDPSIWCQAGGEDHRQPCWHGHLVNGVWEG